jgi:hypothetical protein
VASSEPWPLRRLAYPVWQQPIQESCHPSIDKLKPKELDFAKNLHKTQQISKKHRLRNLNFTKSAGKLKALKLGASNMNMPKTRIDYNLLLFKLPNPKPIK